MKKISDDFLNDIMSESKKIHDINENRNPTESSKPVMKQQSSGSSNTKGYLLEQLDEMAQQINHLRKIAEKM